MRQGRAVVVTGYGLRCAAGSRAVLPRVSFAEPHPAATALGIAGVAQVAGLVEDPRFPDDRKGSLAAEVVKEALAVEREGLDGARLGLFLGTGLSSMTAVEVAAEVYPCLEKGEFNHAAAQHRLKMLSTAPLRHMPARVTELLGAAVGAILTETSFSACAASAMSIAEGARAVARGDVDVALAGGHDSMVHPLGMLSFVVLGALSPGVSRPFDRRRDGFLLGEGAAVLRLEAEEHARARGAPILARWLGAGTSVDAWNVTAPHPEGHGAALAMARALRDAGLVASDIDYVNTHGTGTPIGDRAEALAVRKVLGDVPVSSFKGAVGHTIAAAGAVEATLCLAAFQEGRLPLSVGAEELDPECPVNVLMTEQRCRPRAILSNSFGFGGQNCAIILGAP